MGFAFILFMPPISQMKDKKVNIKLRMTELVSLNLLSSDFGCEIIDCTQVRASIAIRDANGQCPLMGNDVLNAQCLLEWPDHLRTDAVVESVKVDGTNTLLNVKFLKPIEAS
jgi:hypothetical protein